MEKRLHKQVRQNTCAVASLRTVLDVQLGIKVSEQVLEAHGTSAEWPITKYGTSTSQLRTIVRAVNRTHNTTTRSWRLRCHVYGQVRDLVRELSAGRTPLVRVFENQEDIDDYHMIVVLGCEAGFVKVFDPNPHEVKDSFWMDDDTFTRWWAGDGHTTWYAVINAD